MISGINRLNNRKAKLARVGKEVCGLPEGDNGCDDNQGGSIQKLELHKHIIIKTTKYKKRLT